MAPAASSSPFRIVHTVCSHDCPDSCAVLVTVNEEGRAIKVAGDPSQPMTQGFLCGKVAKYLDRVYAPDRILYPLRRKPGVPKGPLQRGREHEAFERVSWDEALDAIAARLQQISDQLRPGIHPALQLCGHHRSCLATARWIDASSIAWAQASSTAPSALRPAARRGSSSTGRNSGMPT